MNQENLIKNEYFDFIKTAQFPCVAAKTALIHNNLRVFVASHIACGRQDKLILQFLYDFIDFYHNSKESIFLSAAIIFADTNLIDEDEFENLMWQRLQNISDLDAKNFKYDKRVSFEVMNDKFSFSLKEESFFIIGLHKENNRKSRRFKYPTLVFNPHQQFEMLREKGCFDKIKKVIRQRDKKISGNVNPMLQDYGLLSEAYQYSGKKYDEKWLCPLKINHNNHGN